MHRYHRLRSSSTQRKMLLGTYLLTAAIIYFCLSPPVLMWAVLMSLAVSALIEYRRLIQQEKLVLRVIPKRSAIEIRQADQSYLYFKYKVYQTRWFAILKLIDRHKNRTLILNSDCFESPDSYRLCRFDLRRLESIDAA